MLASDTQLLIPVVLQKYPLVDESPLSLPLAQGASVLWTPSKGYKTIALPIGGGVCCVCLAIPTKSGGAWSTPTRVHTKEDQVGLPLSLELHAH